MKLTFLAVFSLGTNICCHAQSIFTGYLSPELAPFADPLNFTQMKIAQIFAPTKLPNTTMIKRAFKEFADKRFQVCGLPYL
jgi:hypothetical protein